jgi:hypothetical protein
VVEPGVALLELLALVDGVPDGYRSMAGRTALKVFIKP